MAGYIGTRAAVASPGTERKKTFAITTTTTNLTGLSYTPGFVHVYHNGIRLVDSTDYTATDGSTITLTTAAENGDEVVVVSYGTFSPADAYTKSETYTKTEADDRYVNASGDTMTGTLSVTGVDRNEDALRVGASAAATGYGLRIGASGATDPLEIWREHSSGDQMQLSVDYYGRVTMPYQPAFRAVSPASGNFTTVSGGVIPFTSAPVNVGGHFNTSNSRFTCPVNGTYIFCFVGFNNGSSGERISFVVNNTSKFGQGSRMGATNDWDQTAIATLSAGDYVEVKSLYGGATIYLAPEHTEFSGWFLG